MVVSEKMLCLLSCHCLTLSARSISAAFLFKHNLNESSVKVFAIAKPKTIFEMHLIGEK